MSLQFGRLRAAVELREVLRHGLGDYCKLQPQMESSLLFARGDRPRIRYRRRQVFASFGVAIEIKMNRYLPGLQSGNKGWNKL